MTQQELEDILLLETSVNNHELFESDPILKKFILNAMKEAYNKGVKDSAENAETTHEHQPGDSVTKTRVNKQSILKLLIP